MSARAALCVTRFAETGREPCCDGGAMRYRSERTLAALLLAALVGCAPLATPPATERAGTVPAACALTEPQAIAIAERFVRDNGYTAAPPDLTAYRPEPGDHGSVSEVLAARRDTLTQSADMAAKAPDSEQWLVLFRFTGAAPGREHPEHGDEIGRVVRLDPCGRPIRVERQPAVLDAR
jgi:hypothetical protein